MIKYTEEEISSILGIRTPVLMMQEAVIENDQIQTSYSSDNEEFWNCHFIDNPIMPGTYMLEMLAQSAALLEMTMQKINEVPIITSIDHVRFIRAVIPDQRVTAVVKIKEINGSFFTTTGKITYEGKTVCKAEMLHIIKQ